jgi:hypothetical protein
MAAFQTPSFPSSVEAIQGADAEGQAGLSIESSIRSQAIPAAFPGIRTAFQGRFDLFLPNPGQ